MPEKSPFYASLKIKRPKKTKHVHQGTLTPTLGITILKDGGF